MKADRIRALLAQEAARIMAEDGYLDYLAAKRKAGLRLGVGTKHLPTNKEIMDALENRQRLFESNAHFARVHKARLIANDVMDLFDGMEIRAAGAAAGAVSTEHTPVEVHAFVEPVEKITVHLVNNHVEFRLSERKVRWCNGRTESIPVFSFECKSTMVEVLAFPLTALREAPASPLDGRPMRRISHRRLQELIAAPAV